MGKFKLSGKGLAEVIPTFDIPEELLAIHML